MTKRLFREDHPIITGFIILTGMFLLFILGMTFFISMMFRPDERDIFAKKDGVGVVEINGVIVSSKEAIERLVAFRKNDYVKAIVLRIDSPGGTVGAAQEIYEEVRRTNKIKPVVASLGSVAASGGYYVALGAERIIANPGTLTGSMGVILKFANLEELFSKIGYKVEIVKSGKLKDIGSSSRPMTKEERELLQAVLDNTHDQFIDAIASSRALPEEKVRKLADGRVFSGEQAKTHGLIDEFGNLMDAANVAAKLAGLDEEYPHLIYPVERDFSLLKILTGERSQVFSDLTGINNSGISYEWTLSR